MTVKRKIIDINEELCDGCGQCVIACAEGAIKIIDDKAKVISDNLCDGLGACIGDCPQGALKIVERETDEFDEDAVEKHLEQQKKAEPMQDTLPCGCPSTQIQDFSKETTCLSANKPVSLASEERSPNDSTITLYTFNLSVGLTINKLYSASSPTATTIAFQISWKQGLQLN